MNDLPRIGFLGGVNAMPMAYALKFKRDGFDVKYIVESAAENHLMRPEHHYSNNIAFPYPNWIKEIPWENDLFHAGQLPWTNRAALEEMTDRDVLFLNDYGISLSPWLPQKSIKVALSSGGDIDQHCQWRMALHYARNATPRILSPIWLIFALRRIQLQRNGLNKCELISYFPSGLNPVGDNIIKNLCKKNAQLIPRYDVNFDATGIWYRPPKNRALRHIIVPVRFKIETTKGAEVEYKGNDIILHGLAAYKRRNPEIMVHLFEKGSELDLLQAKKLIDALELSSNIIWHQTLPLKQLFELYAQCDVCIDQVGSHWMGAVGCYALYMGLPLIANARPEIFDSIWGPNSPILNAQTEEEIVNHLTQCESIEFRLKKAENGHDFAIRHLDTEPVYVRLRDAAMKKYEALKQG